MSLNKLKNIAIDIANTGTPEEKNDLSMILIESLKNYGNGGIMTNPDIAKEYVNEELLKNKVVTNNKKRSRYISGKKYGTARIKQLEFHTQFVISQHNILPDIIQTYKEIFSILDPISYLDNTPYKEFYMKRASLIDIANSTNSPFEGVTSNPDYLYLSPFKTDPSVYFYNT